MPRKRGKKKKKGGAVKQTGAAINPEVSLYPSGSEMFVVRFDAMLRFVGGR